MKFMELVFQTNYSFEGELFFLGNFFSTFYQHESRHNVGFYNFQMSFVCTLKWFICCNWVSALKWFISCNIVCTWKRFIYRNWICSLKWFICCNLIYDSLDRHVMRTVRLGSILVFAAFASFQFINFKKKLCAKSSSFKVCLYHALVLPSLAWIFNQSRIMSEFLGSWSGEKQVKGYG